MIRSSACDCIISRSKTGPGRNPFGTSALDLKALYLGLHLPEVRTWRDTSLALVTRRHPTGVAHTHGALDDAREQAEVCLLLLAERGVEPPGIGD